MKNSARCVVTITAAAGTAHQTDSAVVCAFDITIITMMIIIITIILIVIITYGTGGDA